jgi:hypothetical protein
VARLSATHKRAQTVSGLPQSLTRSFEVSGSQTDLLTPWCLAPPLERERERERDEFIDNQKVTEGPKKQIFKQGPNSFV